MTIVGYDVWYGWVVLVNWLDGLFTVGRGRERYSYAEEREAGIAMIASHAVNSITVFGT